MITNSTFSNDQETMELIDRYLLEQLDEIELKQFQDRMEQDFNLRSLVLEQKQEMRAVEDYSLNQAMNSFHEEALREKITKKMVGPCRICFNPDRNFNLDSFYRPFRGKYFCQ